MKQEIKKGVIASDYFDAGREFTILGDAILVNGTAWVPILYDNEDDPDFLKADAVEEVELRTSEKWLPTLTNTKILDPDGWDRSNYQFSFYEERITMTEFMRRVCMSTVQRTITQYPSNGNIQPKK